MDTSYIVVLITAKDLAEAKKISQMLLEKRLAACINISERVNSNFLWEGKVDHATESLLIVKSRRELFDKIVKAVKSVHSYSVPEIIALPIILGEEKYLKWISDST